MSIIHCILYDLIGFTSISFVLLQFQIEIILLYMEHYMYSCVNLLCADVCCIHIKKCSLIEFGSLTITPRFVQSRQYYIVSTACTRLFGYRICTAIEVYLLIIDVIAAYTRLNFRRLFERTRPVGNWYTAAKLTFF